VTGVSPPLAALTVMGSTLANQKIHNTYTAKGAFRVVVAGFVLGFVMYGANGLDADVGAAFSWFVITVALLANGIPVIQQIGRM
jgi:hypothetical protein